MMGATQGATKKEVKKIRKELKKKDGITISKDEADSFAASAAYAYIQTLAVKGGPIRLNLEGQVVMAEQDRDAWRARMDVDATDRRIRGAVKAAATMQLSEREDGQTDLAIHTDASIMGKLGQFGQAVLRKKAQQVMAEFADNMSRMLAS